MIHFSCPRCAKHLKAENHLVQRKTRCPACQSVILVPKSIGQLVETDQPVEVTEEYLPAPQGISLPVQDGYDHYPAVPASQTLPDLYSSDLRQRRTKTGLFFLSLMIVFLAIGVPVLILAIKSAPAAKPTALAQDPDRSPEPGTKPQPVPEPPKEQKKPSEPPPLKKDDPFDKIPVEPKPLFPDQPKLPDWERHGLELPDNKATPSKPAVMPKPEPPFPVPGERLRRIKVGYETRKINGFLVLLSTQAITEGEKVNGRPFRFLADEFAGLGKAIPAKILPKLRRVTFQIDWDNEDPDSPRTVTRYRPAAGVVEVLSLNKMSQYKQRLVNNPRLLLLHDLAYVHHRTLRNGFANPEVRAVYEQAMARKLYHQVQDERGVVGPAFAAVSPTEYFAELSCAYLDRGRCFPFTRDELKAHDPTGYELMEAAWGKVAPRDTGG